MAFLSSLGAAGGAGAMGAASAEGAGLGSLLASSAVDSLSQSGMGKERPPIQYPQLPMWELQQQQQMQSNIYPLLSLLK